MQTLFGGVILVKFVTRGLVAALALTLAVTAIAGAGGASGQEVAAFKLSPQQQTVNLSSGTVSVDVNVVNVTDMASFEFTLRYDRGVLRNPAVVSGPFLGSTGRHVSCLEPVVDSESNGPGTLQFGCATLALGEGVSGSGLLATVTFDLAGGSQTALVFEETVLTNANADSVCAGGALHCGGTNGSITVNGGNPSLNKGLSSRPSVNAPPPEPTPAIGGIPISGAGNPTPTTGTGNGDAPSGGSTGPAGQPAGQPGGSGTTGNRLAPGNTTGPAGPAGGTAPTGVIAPQVGEFGSGPVDGGRDKGLVAAFAALAMAAVGLMIVRAGLAQSVR